MNEVPDYCEIITGWRAWRVVGNRLYAITCGVEWPARETLVAHHVVRHVVGSAPASFCTMPVCDLPPGSGCGIYAFKHFADLCKSILNSAMCYSPAVAIGTVSLWGRDFAEHQHGYRAGNAYPQQLLALLTHKGVQANESLRGLTEAYGISIMTAEDLCRLAPKSDALWSNLLSCLSQYDRSPLPSPYLIRSPYPQFLSARPDARADKGGSV